MIDVELPWFASAWYAILVFLLALIGFHVWLVLWKPLTKIAWKKVDYIWVSLGILGVIANGGTARREIAKTRSEAMNDRLRSAREQVKGSIAFGQGPAICRKFVRSEGLPPVEEFDRLQREFDGMCTWFVIAERRLAQTGFAKDKPIQMESLGTPLPQGADPWALENLRSTIEDYNRTVERIAKLSEAEQPSEIEDCITFIGPFLVAIAIALRLTKVTGEVRLDRT